jgi:hypothetical protein
MNRRRLLILRHTTGAIAHSELGRFKILLYNKSHLIWAIPEGDCVLLMERNVLSVA